MLENKTKKFRQKNELRSIDLYRIVEHFIYILRKNHISIQAAKNAIIS